MAMVAGALLLVAGCSAGRDFQRPDPGGLQLGKTSESDITGRFGEPRGVATRLVNDRTVKTLSYSYAEANPYVEKIPARVMVFTFTDGVLVGHQFLSSFDSDKTDFDENRVGQIKRGQTTIRQVMDLIGVPAGELIHPLAKVQDGKAYVYGYSRSDKEPFTGKLTTRSKTLIVNFDAAGVVTDIDLSTTGK
jgi:hypothetical protein